MYKTVPVLATGPGNGPWQKVLATGPGKPENSQTASGKL